MRGRQEPQVTMLAFVDLDARVPPDHPLRIIKAWPTGPWRRCPLSSTGCTPRWADPPSHPSGC